MPPGVAGFVVAYRRRVPSVVVTGGWVLLWLVAYAVVGTTSSYWGMWVMPVACLGCALLPVGLLGPAPAWSGRFEAGEGSAGEQV